MRGGRGGIRHLARLLGLPAGLVIAAFLHPAPAHAECGGGQQCIAVSIDPAVAPFHGSPDTSAPLDFGNQTAATTSAPRTIFVGAVTGPAGTSATLSAITLGGANAADFTITGGTCTVGTATLLHDGPACTITVTFNPQAVGAKTAMVSVVTAAITRVVPLTGTGTPSLTGPDAAAATLSVAVNSSATLDLAPFITGTVTGVAIVTPPAHGVATATGTSVTYTPARDYFGPDSFTYAAFNDTGSSLAAPVTVTVSGRPDPSRDANVIGLVSSQARTVRRFSRAQILNFQRRMESLHRSGNADGSAASDSPGSRIARDPGRRAGDALVERTAAASLGAGAGAIGPGIASDTQPAVALAQAMPEPGGLRAAGRPDAAPGLRLPAFLTTLAGAAASGSVNLSYSTDSSGASPGLPEGTSVWIGGNLHFGTRDPTGDSSSLRFRTEGVSVGMDRRFTDRLALGLGVGYADDRTDIGTDGTQSRSRAASIIVYGSYQPTRNTFIDSLIGYGDIKHDMDRFVPAVSEFARSHRRSDQFFGSLAAGYEHRREGLLLSPYGRLDFAYDRFKQATETGAGQNALTYFDHDLSSLQLSLGLRAESAHETRFGWALPRLRVEFQHEFEGDRGATIAYADQPAGPQFSVKPTGMKRNALLVGIGSDFLFRGGLRLAADYQLRHTSGADRSHAVRLWLMHALDGNGSPPAYLASTMYGSPVRVEAGVMWDDNLTRARESADRISDHIYSLNVSKRAVFEVTDYTRVVATAFLDGEKPYRYAGLDRIAGGIHGEFQYRTSAEFDAVTFGVFGRALLEEYESRLRSGHRYSFGLNARQSLTDRIDAFGALARNVRNARDTVFDVKDYSGRLNFDYSLNGNGTIYLGGEYRRGSTVSTGAFSFQSIDIAEAFVQDDAFGRATFFAYRLKAKTLLGTLGYNLPLGPRDSLDFSWRRAESTPTYGGSGLYQGGKARYTVNQLSAVYLMRF
jgi:uncharacterized protein with beta-barrel porin domain